MMDDRQRFANDMSLVAKLLAGDPAALSEFDRRFRGQLIESMTNRAGEEHSQLGIDAATEFLSECVAPFGGSDGKSYPPRLSRYDGSTALAWTLYRWCLCKLLDKLRTLKHTVPVDDDATEAALQRQRGGTGHKGEQEIVTMIHDCITRALDAADAEGLVLTRLAFLFKVPQNRLAEIWGVHPAQICRTIKSTLEGIRTKTLACLRRHDQDLDIKWEDLLQLGADTVGLLWDDAPPPHA